MKIAYGTAGSAATDFSGSIDPAGTVIGGLTNGSAYTFTVRTVDTTGNESDGSTVTATPAASEPPLGSISLDPADWVYYNHDGSSYVELDPLPDNRLESSNGELVFYGHEYRGAFSTAPQVLFDFTNATLYAKWKANGPSGNYMGVGFLLAPSTTSLTGWTGTQSTGFTTNNSFGGSVVVPDDTWIYTRVTFDGDGFDAYHAWNDYDDAGGTLFDSETKTGLTSLELRPVFNLSDNYGGTSARINVGEVSTDAPLVVAPTDLFSDDFATDPTSRWSGYTGDSNPTAPAWNSAGETYVLNATGYGNCIADAEVSTPDGLSAEATLSVDALPSITELPNHAYFQVQVQFYDSVSDDPLNWDALLYYRHTNSSTTYDPVTGNDATRYGEVRFPAFDGVTQVHFSENLQDVFDAQDITALALTDVRKVLIRLYTRNGYGESWGNVEVVFDNVLLTP